MAFDISHLKEYGTDCILGKQNKQYYYTFITEHNFQILRYKKIKQQVTVCGKSKAYLDSLCILHQIHAKSEVAPFMPRINNRN
jgi:hypothetical protein